MSGIAMIMIDASIVTSSAPIVVLVSATHLYLPPGAAATEPCPLPRALIATQYPPALTACS